MKRSHCFRLLTLMLAFFVFTGCDTADSDDDVDPAEEIVGTWLSAGDDVAPGLATNSAFPTESITATFEENGTYEVVATSTGGASVTFTGTYETESSANGDIRTIVLNQSQPTALVSRGIYEIDDETMRYEVIQTDPALQGFTAATAEGGFGSTTFNGTELGDVWIQTYVEQD